MGNFKFYRWSALAMPLAAIAHPALADAADAGAADQTTIIVTGHAQPGPSLSATGAGDYAVTAADIARLPTGGASPMTDVLAQMPGVAIDQNQQIHIRNTEGPQFQYQINGALVPLDINGNPPFLSMINPRFVQKLDLIDGVLPSRYAYATGGVVDIHSKSGCAQPGGSVSLLVGQRGTIEPSAEYGGCSGRFSYYLNGQYERSNTAFSSATPGVEPIHDLTHQGQGFGFFSYALDDATTLSLTLSASSSNNQLPNVPGLAPQFVLAGVTPGDSAAINSNLDFRDQLAILDLAGGQDGGFTWHLAGAAHVIKQEFLPDQDAELIYQGVASTAIHQDHDLTLQGDVGLQAGAHKLEAGFYAGRYVVNVADSTLAFPADGDGNQIGDTPVRIDSPTHMANLVLGLYVSDLWQITERLKLDAGLRLDRLSGFTDHAQLDPTVNLSYNLTGDVALHAGFARYMQVPGFQGFAPDAAALFSGPTTAAVGSGTGNPLTEDDAYWDAGLTARLNQHFKLSFDSYFELTDHYLDTGQFGSVPIFAPFNYGRGHIWGTELALNYQDPHLSAYANLTVGQNWQKGVVTGQFNFDPDELAFINTHAILLDHQPLVGVSAGLTYKLAGWSLSLDAIYSSGLRGGFADQEALPAVVQANASLERKFRVRGIGWVTDRLTILNLTDRTNLIRPAEGIGIYQAAYGPRFTVQNTLSIAI
jgi:outer membrane cobalamin receptor